MLSNLQQPVAPCCEVTKQSREKKLKQETAKSILPEIQPPFASLLCEERSSLPSRRTRQFREKQLPYKKKLLPKAPQQQQRQSPAWLRTDKRPDLPRRLLQMRLYRLNGNTQLRCGLLIR